jgi:hypothetical protein
MISSIQRVVRWFFITSLVALISACYTIAGIDMSIEGRHKLWIDEKKKILGENVYGCAFWFCVDHQRSDLFIGEANLSNGHKERGFRYGRFDLNNPLLFPQCHYYYEYDPKTGVIINFRFEESERFTCRLSGA